MSKFFIDRPIFAIVVALVLVIIGTIAGLNLPIAQYPQIFRTYGKDAGRIDHYNGGPCGKP